MTLSLSSDCAYAGAAENSTAAMNALTLKLDINFPSDIRVVLVAADDNRTTLQAPVRHQAREPYALR